MTHFTVDLEDGQQPISFSLKTEDGRRFMVFMQKYNEADNLLRRLGDAVGALDGTTVENENLVDDYRAYFR